MRLMRSIEKADAIYYRVAYVDASQSIAGRLNILQALGVAAHQRQNPCTPRNTEGHVFVIKGYIDYISSEEEIYRPQTGLAEEAQGQNAKSILGQLKRSG